MSILNKLMSNRKKPEIPFGIHSRCYILSIDNDEITNSEGERLNMNTHIKFGKKNKEGDFIQELKISWFDLDSTKERVYTDFLDQLDAMTSIADLILGVDDKGLNKWDEKLNAIFEEEEIETEKDLVDVISTQKSCTVFMKQMCDAFAKLLSKKVGEDSEEIRLKVVYDYKGVRLRQPSKGKFIESASVKEEDSLLSMSQYDLDTLNKNKKLLKPATMSKVSEI